MGAFPKHIWSPFPKYLSIVNFHRMCSVHPPNPYGHEHFGIILLIQAILSSVREKTQGCFYPYFPATLSTDSGCRVMGQCVPVILFCGGPQLSLSLSKLLGNPLSSPCCKCHISRAGQQCMAESGQPRPPTG